MAGVRIEDIEWHQGNAGHATRHGVSADEIEQVFMNGPTIRKNKKGRAADFVAIGTTSGGRHVRVNFLYSPDVKSARPISAWEL